MMDLESMLLTSGIIFSFVIASLYTDARQNVCNELELFRVFCAWPAKIRGHVTNPVINAN